MHEERFTARMFVEFFLKSSGKTHEDMKIAPTVVLTWFDRVVESMAKKTGAEPVESGFYGSSRKTHYADMDGKKVTFIRATPGAPITVAMLEEMHAFGAERFIGLGWAGGLLPSYPVGSMYIPGACKAEEGTSPHYFTGKIPSPDENLKIKMMEVAKKKGISLPVESHWTIDAPYRELKSKIVEYQKEGVAGVDMETSAMYSFGAFRKVPVCNLVIISDELWEDWNPHFFSPALKEAEDVAEDIILETIRNL